MALRVSSITETDTSSKSDSKSKEHSQSQSRSDSQSTTKKLLDSDLMNQILGGLVRNMTDEEINQFAENLLRPQLNAALEESRQNYETTKLSKEQELENLAASLTRAIDEQNSAYRQSKANVETAALNRGMGRSSYTLQTLANQGDALLVPLRERVRALSYGSRYAVRHTRIELCTLGYRAGVIGAALLAKRS